MTRNSSNSNNNNNIINNNSNNTTSNVPAIYEPLSSKYNDNYRNLSKHKFTEYEKMFLCECYENDSSAIKITATKG